MTKIFKWVCGQYRKQAAFNCDELGWDGHGWKGKYHQDQCPRHRRNKQDVIIRTIAKYWFAEERNRLRLISQQLKAKCKVLRGLLNSLWRDSSSLQPEDICNRKKAQGLKMKELQRRLNSQPSLSPLPLSGPWWGMRGILRVRMRYLGRFCWKPWCSKFSWTLWNHKNIDAFSFCFLKNYTESSNKAGAL